MSMAHFSTIAAEVPAYAQLQREVHDALLVQHPEWILPNGDSPTCDSYDARFAELLLKTVPTRSRPPKQGNAPQFQFAFPSPSPWRVKANEKDEDTSSLQPASGIPSYG